METTPVFCRPTSFFERRALIAAEMSPPGANQLVLEGSGDLDVGRWLAAVSAASQANPGSRLILKRSWHGLQWVDSGRTPPVRVVEDSRWSGTDQENAPFLQRRLPPDKGPTCEVLLIRGEPLRVMFRTLHAVMDGRGTLAWMDDIFRALRNEPLMGSRSTVTDFQLVRELRAPLPRVVVRRKPGWLFPAPTGDLVGSQERFVSRRIRIEGPVSNLLAKLSLLIAKHARTRSPRTARIAISVDLRRRAPDIRSTANLVRDIYVDVHPGATVEGTNDNIRQQLEAEQESYSFPLEGALQHFPLGLIRSFSRLGRKRLGRGDYRVSALIANMGRVSLDRFQGGGFTSEAVFAIPPGHPTYPLFVAIFGYGNTIDLFATTPVGLATGGRLDRLMEAILMGLSTS